MVKKALFGGSTPSSVFADVCLTIFRVMGGLAMAFAHGLGKVPPSERFIGGVESMGFPLPALFAWAAGLSELVGGILIALGLLTRPAATFLLGTMAVAFFIRHSDDPFRDKELAFLFLGFSLVYIGVGSGRFGIDRFIRGRK